MQRKIHRSRVSTLAAAALLSVCGAAATAAPIASYTFTNVPSYKVAGAPGNAYRSIPYASVASCKRIFFSGTLHRNTAGTFPREASIRITALTHLAPNISVVTDEFIAQPLTTTTFDASGDAVIARGSFVLPVPENLSFGNGFDSIGLFQPGHFDLEFFEQYDDNSADSGPTPDATWSSITLTLDDGDPSLATDPPQTGTVATTTRYGVQSDDTLDPGPFTGSIISNMSKPVGDRIRHVRITGYLTTLSYSTTNAPTSQNPASQARLRLVRYESVLLSPQDPAYTSTNDELFVSVPSNCASTQYISMDIPIAENDPFGKLTRAIQSGGPNESYGGISYYMNSYESIDDWASPDNIWNGLKVEFFTDAQPASSSVDFGLLHASPAGSETVATRTATMAPGLAQWFRFELPVNVTAADGSFLDIDTENTSPLFDTIIGLYKGDGPNAGERLGFDDDDGSGNLSQFSFGVGGRPAIGTSAARNGRDGTLLAGVYYVAVIPYVSGTGTAALGTTNFLATNPDHAASHSVTLNLRFNVPQACGLADICGIGGPPAPADGLLTGDDFNAFIAAFASGDPLADVCGIGGPPNAADGLVTGDDFNAFIAAFAAGCP